MGVSNGFAAPAKLMPLDILANVGTIRAVVTEAAGVPGPPGFPIKVALKICVRFHSACASVVDANRCRHTVPELPVYWAL
jgi:hypothetical protein